MVTSARHLPPTSPSLCSAPYLKLGPVIGGPREHTEHLSGGGHLAPVRRIEHQPVHTRFCKCRRLTTPR
eukprot:8596669-Pyramimonas_sp.AAC.1